MERKRKKGRESGIRMRNGKPALKLEGRVEISGLWDNVCCHGDKEIPNLTISDPINRIPDIVHSEDFSERKRKKKEKKEKRKKRKKKEKEERGKRKVEIF